MGLTANQRPSQTIDGEVSTWNAVGNPILYKFQRKDFVFDQINDNGGFVQLQFNGVNITSSFANGDSLYVASDNSVYDDFGVQTAEAFSGGNTLITTDIAYVSAAPGGFANNDTLRPSYRVEVELYNILDELVSGVYSYSPSSKGYIKVNAVPMIKANLSPDNDADLTVTTEVFDDTNVYLGFYIKYREVWTGSAESQTNDVANQFFAVLGSRQIPSLYGGNMYENLLTIEVMKQETTMTSAQLLASFTTPITVVAAVPGKIIVPILIAHTIDFNSAAYATNTTAGYQINGNAVTSTTTELLAAAADRFRVLLNAATSVTVDVSTLVNQPLVFKTSGGNPTTGDSDIKVTVIYTLIDL